MNKDDALARQLTQVCYYLQSPNRKGIQPSLSSGIFYINKNIQICIINNLMLPCAYHSQPGVFLSLGIQLIQLFFVGPSDNNDIALLGLFHNLMKVITQSQSGYTLDGNPKP